MNSISVSKVSFLEKKRIINLIIPSNIRIRCCWHWTEARGWTSSGGNARQRGCPHDSLSGLCGCGLNSLSLSCLFCRCRSCCWGLSYFRFHNTGCGMRLNWVTRSGVCGWRCWVIWRGCGMIWCRSRMIRCGSFWVCGFSIIGYVRNISTITIDSIRDCLQSPIG